MRQERQQVRVHGFHRRRRRETDGSWLGAHPREDDRVVARAELYCVTLVLARLGRRWSGSIGGSSERWHVGQRGSHFVSESATPMWTVMKESGKWRSGRALVRTGFHFSSGRGGNSVGVFSDNEGVTEEDGGNVLVPATIGGKVR